MLTLTFRHLQGIGAKTERKLWEQGIRCWQDFKAREHGQAQQGLFGESTPSKRLREIEESQRAFDARNADFFAARLPRHEHYRIALTFPLETLFLDIESTGLSRFYDAITLIGWQVGEMDGTYIQGGNLDPLVQALAAAKAIVTFNGSTFDLPFLESELGNFRRPIAHVDLRFFVRRAGLAGGQKEIEAKLGLGRVAGIAGLQSNDAPLLWQRYRRGDLSALETLIAYNGADLVGMKHIFDHTLERLSEKNELPAGGGERHRFASKVASESNGNGNSQRDRVIVLPPAGVNLWKPRATISALGLGNYAVVGIDLTGSETKPSGWCSLDASGKAVTRRVGTDEELIERTLALRPDVVSIDSPLTLPKGRTRVTDDDPERKSAGIMRICERVLKSRGINVYPCLIPSMQKLTARGMRLAQALRAKGMKVIESYPGAAQDIMGIPRKRADLALLRAGLTEFGVSGAFVDEVVSHDELEAITSAIVGLFFLADMYEGLGNQDEDYLIIPDLKKLPI